MKSKFKIYGIYMIVYLLLLPTLVTLGAVACMNHLGEDGYFTVTTLADIANVGVTAAALFLFTYVFSADKKVKLIPSFTSPLNYGPCAVMAAALVFISVHLVSGSRLSDGGIDAFSLAVGALALISVIYFAVSAISVKRRSIMRSDFGIIVLVFLCLYIAYIFFDNGTPINAPIKTATMMAFLFFSLFFLYETRLSLGREKWHFYVAFAFISSLVSAYASIPALVVYMIKGEVIGISIYETVLVFAFFLFATFKLFLVGELVPENGSNLVKKIIESAKARIDELAPEEPMAEENSEEDEIDENQFSILDTEQTEDEAKEEGGEPNDVSDEEASTGSADDDVSGPTDSEARAETNDNPYEDGTRVTENEVADLENEEINEKKNGSTPSDDTKADGAEAATVDTESLSSESDTRVTSSDEKDDIK